MSRNKSQISFLRLLAVLAMAAALSVAAFAQPSVEFPTYTPVSYTHLYG